VSGDSVVVGSPDHDGTATNSGAAYVFTRTASAWNQSGFLAASDGAAGDQFGVSVAIDATTVVAGAFTAGPGGSESGAAYVFTHGGGQWSQLTELAATDSTAGNQFGIAVGVSGNIVIGAYLDDVAGNNSGSAYVFAH